MDLLRYFEKLQTKDVSRPRLKPGDIVRVETKIQEGEKARLQVFEGTVLGIRGSGPSASFTVRRDTSGFAVERIFPLYSPLITNIEIVKRQKVRRAKLNYLRHAGRQRVKEDEKAMQRHVKEEGDKKRLIDEAKKRAADVAAAEAAREAAEAKRQEEAKQADVAAEASAKEADEKAQEEREKELAEKTQAEAKQADVAAPEPETKKEDTAETK